MPGMPRALYSSPPQAQISRRGDHARQHPLPPVGMDWRLAHGHYHQQLPPAPPATQSDWLLPEDLGSLKSEYGKHEYNAGAVGSEEPMRGSYVFQQQAPQATSHEVSYVFVLLLFFRPSVIFAKLAFVCAYIHFYSSHVTIVVIRAHTTSLPHCLVLPCEDRFYMRLY
jgi:hypothetical protein